MTDVTTTLDELRRRGLLRELRVIDSPTGPRVSLDGRSVLLLCSNDYLGLAGHPAVRAAAAEAAREWGAGAGASRLVSGNLAPHRALERELAAFKGSEACVLFGSGYLANTGVVAALAGEGGVVLSDALNHASLIDGCRLARADTIVYPHCDLDALAAALRGPRVRDRPATIVTDAVFSMDGDTAPLAEIVALAREHGRARVIVDEAHATGLLGPGGRGLVAELGLEHGDDVVAIGTLGKALGSYGAFACCSTELASFLINRARTLIFSTALPPPAVGAARAALALLRDRPDLVTRARTNATTLRTLLAGAGLDVDPTPMPIIPLIAGDAQRALRFCDESLARGAFAQAIRPPTVPTGTSRLRVVTMATHSDDDLRRAAAALADAANAAGLECPATPAVVVGGRRQRPRWTSAKTEPREFQSPFWPG